MTLETLLLISSPTLFFILLLIFINQIRSKQSKKIQFYSLSEFKNYIENIGFRETQLPEEIHEDLFQGKITDSLRLMKIGNVRPMIFSDLTSKIQFYELNSSGGTIYLGIYNNLNLARRESSSFRRRIKREEALDMKNSYFLLINKKDEISKDYFQSMITTAISCYVGSRYWQKEKYRGIKMLFRRDTTSKLFYKELLRKIKTKQFIGGLYYNVSVKESKNYVFFTCKVPRNSYSYDKIPTCYIKEGSDILQEFNSPR